MSALLLILTGDTTVRGTITSDGKQVFSVYDFINLVCQKTESYSRLVWMRLLSEDSNFKDELQGLIFTVSFRNRAKNNRYNTPAMTLLGL